MQWKIKSFLSFFWMNSKKEVEAGWKRHLPHWYQAQGAAVGSQRSFSWHRNNSFLQRRVAQTQVSFAKVAAATLLSAIDHILSSAVTLSKRWFPVGWSTHIWTSHYHSNITCSCKTACAGMEKLDLTSIHWSCMYMSDLMITEMIQCRGLALCAGNEKEGWFLTKLTDKEAAKNKSTDICHVDCR